MKFLSNMPLAVKIALGVVILLMFMLLAYFLREHIVLVMVVLIIGAVIAIGALLIYNTIQKRRERSQGAAFGEDIKQVARNNPQSAASDKARKARLDDMSRVFEEGVAKYRAAGKNLYSLPWYLLVGPPGSGKTEAMRHSSIGFPPGLQDPLQGTGGTLSMHWWFTNTAVVLDTAGRLFMSEGAGGSDNSEWKEFLKLLKRARGKCPINGMLLAVDVETLLKDNSEQIEKKAGLIARQLDVIQRVLDVRFPVFVLVTKCDRIVGFREFFETMNDPQAASQMLGWSNPADLDDAFSPEAVEQHLSVVRDALVKRRRFLLLDPVHTEDPSARRTDQVDAMFAFPDSLHAIGPRLRRFMELIFVAGEWSPKPLFVRGIYFTSSLQEGRSLDEALAKALGCAIDELPGDAVPRKDKSYFLRDMFVGKVFREKGLVTSAVSVSKSQRAARLALVGGGITFALLLIGLSVFGGWRLQSEITGPAGQWRKFAEAYKGVKKPEALDEANPLAIMRLNANGQQVYAGAEQALEDTARAALPVDTQKAAERSLEPGIIFAPVALLTGDSNTLQGERREAHRAIVEATVLAPLVQKARDLLADPSKWETPAADAKTKTTSGRPRAELAAAALAQLIKIDTLGAGKTPESAKEGKGQNIIDVAALIDFVETPGLPDDPKSPPSARKSEIEELQRVVNETYAVKDAVFPPVALRAGAAESKKALASAVANFVEATNKFDGASEFGALNRIFDAVKEFQAIDLTPVNWPSDADTTESGRTIEAYKRSLAEWNQRADKIKSAGDRVSEAIDVLRKAPVDAQTITEKSKAEKARLKGLYDRVINELPPPEGSGFSLDKVKETADATKKVITDKANSSGVGAAQKDVMANLPGKGPEKGDYAGQLRAALKGSQDRVDRQAQEMTDQLQKSETASLLERLDNKTRIARRADAFARATKEHVAAEEEPQKYKPADGASLDAAIKSAAEARDVAKSEIGKLQLDGTLSPKLATSQASINRALDAARAARVYRLLGYYCESDSFRSSQGIMSWAKKLNPGANGAAGSLTVSVLNPDWAADPDPTFRPEAARIIFADFAVADEETAEANKAAERTLGGGALRTILNGNGSQRSAVQQYAQAYFEYWTEGARGVPECRTFSSWDDYYKQISKLNVEADSESVLNALKQQSVAALAAIPEQKGSSKPLIEATRLADARQLIEGERQALERRDARLRAAKALSRWKELSPENPAQALETILASGDVTDIQEQFFACKPGGDWSGSSQFWTSVWFEGTRLLVQKRADDAEKAKTTLRDASQKFPFNAEGRESLSFEEVKQIGELAERVTARPLAGKPLSAPPGSGASVQRRLDQINSGLRRGVIVDQRAVEPLKQMQQLAKVLTDPQGVEFGILYGIPPGSARGVAKPAIEVTSYAQVLVSGKPVKGNTFMNIGQVFDNFQTTANFGTAGEVSILLKKTEDPGKADGTLLLSAPWGVLNGLRGAKGDFAISTKEADKVVWLLPFSVMIEGEDRRLWLKLRAKSQALPFPETWPRGGQLPF